MIALDKKNISDLQNRQVEKILVYLYDGWCSGSKVDIKEDFELRDDLSLGVSLEEREKLWFEIYLEKKDQEKFENARITKVVSADHTGQKQVRYIYSSDDVLDRCGCGTSFGFEKKKIVIDLEKLKKMRERFRK